ncbi:MAG: ERF family protein [Paraclostridium sp.]
MQTSTECDKVLKAYTSYFGEITNPKPTENNSFFKSKYASLDGIIDHIKPILAKYKLSLMQSIGSDGDMISVSTMLVHESGQWIESDKLWIRNQQNKGVSEAQSVGISITYARRYSLGFLGVATDTDTDGNFGSDKSTNSPSNWGQPKQNNYANNTQATPPTNPFGSTPKGASLSDKQIARMYAMGKKAGYSQDQIHSMIHDAFGKSTNDLTKAEYDRICDGLQATIDTQQ